MDVKFENENNYRIINLGNPYDNTYSMFVEHGQTIPVDFDNLIQYNKNTQMCRWKKHKCKKYYIYTPVNNDDNPHYCYREVSLEKDSYYTLLYYIYIPSQTNIKDNEGYIDVEVDNISHKIDEGFLFKDKQLRDQWIYHEVPFIAGDKNIIKIFGPQKYDEDSDYPNSIYFHYLELKKLEQYSPTLKYTDVGLNVTEQNQKIFRPLDNKPCTKVSINPDNKTYEPSIKDFSTPHSNVNIVSKDEKYVYYDKYTSDLIYVTDSDDGAIDYIEETSDLIFPGNEDINFYINDYSLYCDSSKKITGIYGPNNIFFFDFVDENDNFIKEGEVEVSILTQIDKNIDNKGLRVTRSFVPVTGSMVFNNVDLTSLKQDNDTDEYFIRLYYTSECLDEPIIVFKKLYMYDEEISINKIKINDTEYNVEEITEYVIDDVHDFPLKIEVQSINQNNGIQTEGYYELSINDELNQSTLVDDGWGDFYLRQDDLQVGTQTIKISYYRKNYSSLAFVYFDIKVDNLKNLQDYVPIDLKIFKDGFTQALPLNNTIELESDDCALSVIETKNHSKFRIEVYRNDKLIIKKNIYNPVASDINFIHAEWDEWQEHNQYTFKIVTGNMYDDSGNIIQDLYRDYERTFVIKKIQKPI